MQEIKWKRNEFHTFYAQMKIRVGGQTETYVIEQGEEFQFDGSICKYNGSEFAQPGLRGAVKSGWATSDPDGQGALPEAHRPDRNIASAKSVNRDLNRVQRHTSPQMGMSDLDEETVMNINDRGNAMASGRHLQQGDNRRYASSRGMSVNSDAADQDAIPVSRIRTPAKSGPIDVHANPGIARDIENNMDYDRGFGRSNVIHKEGVEIRTNMGPLRGATVVDTEEQGVTVAQVRKTPTRNQEGIQVKDTSKTKQTASSETAKASVKKATTEEPASPKLAEAQKIFSDFPADWNFFGKTEDKLAKLEEIGASGPMVKALMASESKAMKKALKEKYSDLV